MIPSLDWIGGFFDADGSCSLVQSKGNYAPIIHLAQSDEGILDQVSHILIGTVRQSSKAGDVNKYGVRKTRDGFRLHWSNAEAIRVARILINHTICKREELEAIVSYYDKYNNYTKGWGRYADISDEYTRRHTEKVIAAEQCRQLLKNIRANKDTI